MKSTREKLKHKQAPIMYDGEVVFSVDKKLQKLIQFLVDKDIETLNSCEDNVKGTCWIQFELGDWLGLSESSFQSKRQGLYRFIEEECDLSLTMQDDGSPDEKDEYWIEGKHLIWGASVRFAKELLPTFTKHIRATLVDVSSA